eukprot:11173147-Lingulodinium_polyedra.AAC.1
MEAQQAREVQLSLGEMPVDEARRARGAAWRARAVVLRDERRERLGRVIATLLPISTRRPQEL